MQLEDRLYELLSLGKDIAKNNMNYNLTKDDNFKKEAKDLEDKAEKLIAYLKALTLF